MRGVSHITIYLYTEYSQGPVFSVRENTLYILFYTYIFISRSHVLCTKLCTYSNNKPMIVETELYTDKGASKS